MANGWSTFETWKIWHEVFIDLDDEYIKESAPIDPEWCFNYVSVVLEIGEATTNSDGFIENFNSLKDSLVLSWLTKVNWTEISDALNEQLKDE